MPINFVASMLADAVGFLGTTVVQNSNSNVGTGMPVDFQVRRPPIPAPVRYRTGSKFLGMGNKKDDGSFLEARPWDQYCVESDTSEKVQVVWSGYAVGLPTHCPLPAAGGPDIMFTPRLDGCSLTWGPLGGGFCFGHYNVLTEDRTGTVGSAEMQTVGEAHFGGTGFGMISKETYFNKAKRNTVATGDKRTTANAFGVRTGGVWKLYIQFIETDAGGTLQIRGAEELTRGTRYNVG